MSLQERSGTFLLTHSFLHVVSSICYGFLFLARKGMWWSWSLLCLASSVSKTVIQKSVCFFFLPSPAQPTPCKSCSSEDVNCAELVEGSVQGWGVWWRRRPHYVSVLCFFISTGKTLYQIVVCGGYVASWALDTVLGCWKSHSKKEL